MPLTLGNPSGPNATPELLFTPFFLTPSVGGGIDEGTGVPLGTGVLMFESGKASPLEVDATGRVLGDGVDEGFAGDSSFTSTAANDCRALDDSFNLTILVGFDDFRRALGAAALLDEAIMMAGDDEFSRDDDRPGEDIVEAENV